MIRALYTAASGMLIGMRQQDVVADNIANSSTVGYKADLNVIDLDNLKLHAPQMVYDLPDDARRLVQRSEGFTHTIVSGEVVRRDNEPTGKLPGRLVRGRQSL